ncbi:MAG: hypothetical protein R3C19_10180 [Planctomycetaceae bacterium]
MTDDAQGRVLRTSGYRWFPASKLASLPLSTSGRKFADTLV